MTSRKRSSISGNMLIYILGAIFLLGLLIVLIKGNFQEGTGIDPEKTAIQVGEVQRYTAELERAVSYIMRNGASETEIRFAHPTGDAAYSAYGTIATTPTRQVFSATGGGAEWRNPPTGSQVVATPWVFNSNNAVNSVGVYLTRDLLVILPNVTKDFCLRINSVLGVENPGGNPPNDQDYIIVNQSFAGSYTSGAWAAISYNSTSPGMEGCVGITTAGGGATVGNYYYYRVLLAR